MSRTLDTRIQNKCDTAANWKAIQDIFTPLKGELIIYTKYTPENSDVETVAIKYGDGEHTLKELPFVALGTSGESAGKLDPINLYQTTTNGEYRWYDPQDTDDAKWLGTIVVRTDTQVTIDLSIDKVLEQETAVVVVHYQGERNKYRDKTYADITRKTDSNYYYFYAYTDKGVYSDVVVHNANGTVTTYIDPPIKNDSVIYYNGKEHDILDYITNWNDLEDLVNVTNNIKTNAGNYKTTFTLKDSNNIWTGGQSTITLNWEIKQAQVNNFIVEYADGTHVENPLTIPYNETIRLRYKPEFNHLTTLEFGDNILKPHLFVDNDIHVTITETKIENGYIYFNLHSIAKGSRTVYISVITNNNISAPIYELVLAVEKKTLDDYTWEEISAISRAGTAREYFSIGDMKEVNFDGSMRYHWGPSLRYITFTNKKFFVYIVHISDNYDGTNNIYFQCFKQKDVNTDSILPVFIQSPNNCFATFNTSIINWTDVNESLNDMLECLKNEKNEGLTSYMKDFKRSYLSIGFEDGKRTLDISEVTYQLHIPSSISDISNFEYYINNSKIKYLYDTFSNGSWGVSDGGSSSAGTSINNFYTLRYNFEGELELVNNAIYGETVASAHATGLSPIFIL